ncbi:MAG: hypothetical protein IT234_02130 [Bacteroidia bacterium]|jgi:hypothetical protein|nr:hypothetical protein [Bacteroidia bacterium]
MKNERVQWQKYWADIAPRIDAYISDTCEPLVVKYLENSFALFSFVTEDLDSKTTKNKELRSKLDVFIVHTHDLMRGVIATYKNLTLAPIALNLRTIFETHCNLKFIVRSKEAAQLADFYDRFQEIEFLTGVKSSPYLPDPTKDDFDRIMARNPEWFENGKLKKPLHWSSAKTDLASIAASKHVDLEHDYKAIYKTNSKFVHTSPIIRNLYRRNGFLMAIPSGENPKSLALLAQSYCIKTLQEFCMFFGIDFPELDYALIAQDMVESTGRKRLDPKQFGIIE